MTKNVETMLPIVSQIENMYKFCEKNSAWSGIAGAFLTGLFVNAWSDPTIHTLQQLMSRIFNLQERSINILSWLAIFIMVFLTLGKYLSGHYLRQRSPAKILAIVLKGKAKGIAAKLNYHISQIAWGESITLQSCTNLFKGWRTEEVEITPKDRRLFDESFHKLPTEVEPLYENYLHTEFMKDNEENDGRIMLTKTSLVLVDAPTLKLEVERTKWSQLQFYRSCIWKNPIEVEKHDDRILNDEPITIPNSLALLLVVATSDNYVLLTKSNPKVKFSPGKWACSIGEQLDFNDFQESNPNTVSNWINRALREELGVGEEDYDPVKARISALILETQLVNCALVGVIELKISREELTARIMNGISSSDSLRQAPDTKEHKRIAFIHWKNLAEVLMNIDATDQKVANHIWEDLLLKPDKQLKEDKMDFHPSTGLRMLYAGIYRYDVANFTRQLLAERDFNRKSLSWYRQLLNFLKMMI